MKPEQQTKIIPAILPGVIKDDAAYAAQVIDTNSFDGAAYIEFQGMLGSIDAELAVLKVMESEEKTDATTLDGTPTLVKDATTKPGANDDNKVFVIGIDLRTARKRYLQLQATAGNGAAGTYLSAVAVGRPGVSSSDATSRGLLFAEYA